MNQRNRYAWQHKLFTLSSRISWERPEQQSQRVQGLKRTKVVILWKWLSFSDKILENLWVVLMLRNFTHGLVSRKELQICLGNSYSKPLCTSSFLGDDKLTKSVIVTFSVTNNEKSFILTFWCQTIFWWTFVLS